MSRMRKFLILLRLLSIYYSHCITPNVYGSIVEDQNYNEDELMQGEILLNGTKISYLCNNIQKTSVCKLHDWVPEIKEDCIAPECIVPSNASEVNLIGVFSGEHIKHFETISYKCKQNISPTTGNIYGISVCYDGELIPSLMCVSEEFVCKIPQIIHGRYEKKFKFLKFVQNGDFIKYRCNKGYTPGFTLTSELLVGISNCLNGNLTEPPICLKTCDIKQLNNVKHVFLKNNYVANKKFVTFLCDEQHPISNLDKTNRDKNLIPSGIGEIQCINGTFLGKTCFSGCIMPKSVLSRFYYVKNGEDAIYICKNNQTPIKTRCANNVFNPKPFCCDDNDGENEVKFCSLPKEENIIYFGVTNFTLKYGESAIYMCPNFEPISSANILEQDQENFKNYNFVTCDEHYEHPKCFEGCILPIFAISSRRFVFKGTRLRYACPEGKKPNSLETECTELGWYPAVFCIEENRCLVPDVNLQFFYKNKANKYVMENSIIEVYCQDMAYIFKCMHNGEWDPEIFPYCYNNCLSNGNTYRVGEVINYTCPDYFLSISHENTFGASICKPDGFFYPKVSCLNIWGKCSKIPIENVLTSNLGDYQAFIKLNSDFKFMCKSGYSKTETDEKMVCVNGRFNIHLKCHQKCRLLKNRVTWFSNYLIPFNSTSSFKCLDKTISINNLNLYNDCENSEQEGQVRCEEKGLIDTNNKILCNKLCTFPENVITFPKFVFEGNFFAYKCTDEPDVILNQNIRCKGNYLPLCNKNYCVIPEFDSLGIFLYENGYIYTRLNSYLQVSNSSNLLIDCGTYHRIIFCSEGKWKPTLFIKKCDLFCFTQVKWLELKNSSKTKVNLHETVEYFCQTNKSIEVTLTCTNLKMVGNYRDLCLGGCDIMPNSNDFILLDNFVGEKIPVGAKLKYECQGKFHGEVYYECLETGPILGLCKNECQANQYFFGIVMKTNRPRLARFDKFEYQCKPGLISLTESYCVLDQNKMNLLPAPICIKIKGNLKEE